MRATRGRNKFWRNTVKPKEGWLFATAKQKETLHEEDMEGEVSSVLCTKSRALPCIFALTPMQNLWSNNGRLSTLRALRCDRRRKREKSSGKREYAGIAGTKRELGTDLGRLIKTTPTGCYRRIPPDRTFRNEWKSLQLCATAPFSRVIKFLLLASRIFL